MSETKPRILLVEDEIDVLETLALTLSRRGFDVLTALDGLEALKDDKPMHVDLIVSDIRMPNLNGFELYERVVKMRPTLPFLFISGHLVDLTGLIENNQAPKPMLLSKPFTADVLTQTIRDVLAACKVSS